MAELIRRRPFLLREPKKGLRLAITGGIAAGKSTLTGILLGKGGLFDFQEGETEGLPEGAHAQGELPLDKKTRRRRRPIPVYCASADIYGHELYESGSAVVEQVIDEFGESVSDGKGSINRAALAEIVFSDNQSLKKLEKITHPQIRRKGEAFLQGGQRHELRIYDIPLLVEIGGVEADCTIAIETPPKVAVQRMVELRGMTIDEAWARVNAQVSNDYRRTFADIVIVNDSNDDREDKALRELTLTQLVPLLADHIR